LRVKTKRDPRIDAYIGKSAEFSRPILRHLRELVHQGCPDVEETIKWSAPFFMHAGILCFMAAFKEHCTFGFWNREMKKVIANDGGKAESAMGNFGRIKSIADLPSAATLRRYVAAAARLNDSGVPARPRAAPKSKGKSASVIVPSDLKAALARTPKAAHAFESFRASHRREYVEWITDAKRETTRQKRIATTLEWLTKGKSRNWKYEKGRE
jgi:uncharacterized protein YdeI (YjbR/CyaY-like superfamily)